MTMIIAGAGAAGDGDSASAAGGPVPRSAGARAGAAAVRAARQRQDAAGKSAGVRGRGHLLQHLRLHPHLQVARRGRKAGARPFRLSLPPLPKCTVDACTPCSLNVCIQVIAQPPFPPQALSASSLAAYRACFLSCAQAVLWTEDLCQKGACSPGCFEYMRTLPEDVTALSEHLASLRPAAGAHAVQGGGRDAALHHLHR